MNNKSKTQNKYDTAHTRRVGLKLNTKTDKDIITELENQQSMQGFIKGCIRYYIHNAINIESFDKPKK